MDAEGAGEAGVANIGSVRGRVVCNRRGPFLSKLYLEFGFPYKLLISNDARRDAAVESMEWTLDVSSITGQMRGTHASSVCSKGESGRSPSLSRNIRYASVSAYLAAGPVRVLRCGHARSWFPGRARVWDAARGAHGCSATLMLLYSEAGVQISHGADSTCDSFCE